MKVKGRTEMESKEFQLLMDAINGITNNLNEFKKDVSGRFDQMDHRLDQMDQRLNQMDVRLTKLEDKSDMIIKHMVTRDEFATLRNDFEKEKQTTTTMAKDIYQVKSEVLLIRENDKIPT